MKHRFAELLAIFVLAVGSAPAAATPFCTTTQILGPSGQSIVLGSSITSGFCLRSRDVVYGNFDLGNLPAGTTLLFNLLHVGGLDYHQLSFGANFGSGTTYIWGYEAWIGGGLPGGAIGSLDTDFAQAAGGPSTLSETTNPLGIGVINETKIGAVVQPGSGVLKFFAPGATDLVISAQLVDSGTISSTTDTLTEFVPAVHRDPEPASLALLGAGLAGLGAFRRKRKK